jgi:hypothetical protein
MFLRTAGGLSAKLQGATLQMKQSSYLMPGEPQVHNKLRRSLKLFFIAIMHNEIKALRIIF